MIDSEMFNKILIELRAIRLGCKEVICKLECLMRNLKVCLSQSQIRSATSYGRAKDKSEPDSESDLERGLVLYLEEELESVLELNLKLEP